MEPPLDLSTHPLAGLRAAGTTSRDATEPILLRTPLAAHVREIALAAASAPASSHEEIIEAATAEAAVAEEKAMMATTTTSRDDTEPLPLQTPLHQMALAARVHEMVLAAGAAPASSAEEIIEAARARAEAATAAAAAARTAAVEKAAAAVKARASARAAMELLDSFSRAGSTSRKRDRFYLPFKVVKPRKKAMATPRRKGVTDLL